MTRRAIHESELGVISDPETGQLGRPWASSGWSVPRFVELDGENLLYSEALKQQTNAPKPDLLERFIRLDAADLGQIVNFARRWGALGLCAEHGMPGTHRGQDALIRLSLGSSHGCPAQAGAGPEGDGNAVWYSEPLAGWRALARQARSALRVAIALAESETPSREDLARLRERPEVESAPNRNQLWSAAEIAEDLQRMADELPPWDSRRLREAASNLSERQIAWYRDPLAARGILVEFLDYWAALADLRPFCQPVVVMGESRGAPVERGRRVEVLVGGRTLFGGIALQLLSAATQTNGWATCSGCGMLYATSRLPPSGRRRYCIGCRKNGVPLRDAKRDQRQRERERGEGRDLVIVRNPSQGML